MRMHPKVLSLALLALLGLFGCAQRTEQTDGGGVLLSITDFDGLPITVSAGSVVGGTGVVQVQSITVENVTKNPNVPTSALMNVEIQSYEVTFTRADRGTRVPPPLVEYVFGTAPVGGRFVLDNGPVMRLDQFNTQPLKDLVDYGMDRETNSQVVRLTVAIRFFGKTLSGKSVDSAPAYFTLDVVP